MYNEIHTVGIRERASAPEVAMLLDQYESCRRNDDLPSEKDFGLANLGLIGDSCMVLRPLPNGDFLYEHYGRQIAAISGFYMTGKHASDFQGEVASYFLACYERCHQELRPVFSLHRATHVPKVHLWERLILPVRRDASTIILIVLAKVRTFRADLLETMLDAFDCGILAVRFLREDDGRVEDAIIVTANRQASEMTGRAMEEIVDARLLQLFPSLAQRGFWARYLWVAASGRRSTFEVDFVDRQMPGTYEIKLLPMSDGIVIAFTDVTEARRLASETGQKIALLERENERLRAFHQLLGRERDGLATPLNGRLASSL